MALYGTFVYGSELYGMSGLPVSVDFDIFDFCEPIHAVMLSILSYPEVSAPRYGAPWLSFNGVDDLCMYSDDLSETGIRIDLPVPSPYQTVEFTLLPTALPGDFSDLTQARFFVGLFNQFASATGLLISEDGGLATATSALGPATVLHDSADIFDEGLDYYVFRIVTNETTGRVMLYVTRLAELVITGEHRLRYEYATQPCPAGETDNFRIEIVGNVAEPTQVCFDCIRLSSQELIPNRRPVAVIDDDKTCVATHFAVFDGRDSYDPEGAVLRFYWTLDEAPDDSPVLTRGWATTGPDPTGWTNVLPGAPGDYSAFRVGDVIRSGAQWSYIMYVATDGSYVVVIDRDFVANALIEWRYIAQSVWGGSRTLSQVGTVLAYTTVIPGAPAVGDAYLIETGAAPPWNGHVGEVATWNGAGWDYTSPPAGAVYYVVSDYGCYRNAGALTWFPADPLPWELEHWGGVEAQIGSILGASIGVHDVNLIVNDWVMTSAPAVAVLNVYETNVALGYTPDLSFIWEYLCDFWMLPDGTEKFETFWSALAQLSTDELMQLWQHDYAKSILDIQRVHQRRWINYDPRRDEPNYYELPATVDTSVNISGWATAPSPVPIPGDPVPDEARVYVLDAPVAVITAGQYLVLSGVAYRIVRVEGAALITDDAMPTGTDRTHAWAVRPTVQSGASNFSQLCVEAGDTAIFEARTSGDSAVEVSCYVYGVRGSVLCFDPDPLTSYASDTIMFKAVLRRGAIQVHATVQSMPRLQEVIALDRVDSAPDPFDENRDFLVEDWITVQGETVRRIDLMHCFYEEICHGWVGATLSNLTFVDAAATFLTDLGEVGTDLSEYMLVVDGTEYRLGTVVADTRVNLHDEEITAGLVGKSWRIYRLTTPPDHLWAEITYLDNSETIEANFGSMIGFTLDHLAARTDNLDYLSATQGLWYYVWHGRTPERVAAACQIILGLPFAEETGTIEDIAVIDATMSRVLIRDAANTTVVRSYRYPTVVGIGTNPDTDLDYVVGDTVTQFDPLSKGVIVTDYVQDPDWYGIYVGSGDFYEAQKVHTFGVIVDADVFNLVNVQFMINFIKEKRPPYTYPFFAVSKEESDIVDVSDPYMIGPVIPPVPYTYPDTWPLLAHQPTWADSPFEVSRLPVTYAPMTGYTVPAPPREFVTWGGMHLYDSIGTVPENSPAWGHIPERAGSAMKFDQRHGNGTCAHRFDQGSYAVSPLSDGDMEDGINPGAPGSPWDLIVPGLDPVVIVKSGAVVHGGVASCYVSTAGAGYGISQNIHGLVPDGDQIAARGWVYVVSGCAEFRLIDQDGITTLASLKKGVPINTWLQWTLHHWRLGTGAVPIQLEIVSGPAGGEFYVDDVACHHRLMPWDQWGFDRAIGGRTGGYTRGGSPDEYWEFGLYTEI